MAARIDAARIKGSRKMWYMVLADTLVDVFQKQETVSRADLVAELRRRGARDDNGPILDEAYDEAALIVENGLPKDDAGKE
jgi:hypothetical protein